MVLDVPSAAGEIGEISECADGYLPKPFSFTELLALVRGVLWSNGADEEVLKLHGFTILPRTRDVKYRGRLVGLTAWEYDALLLFVRTAGNSERLKVFEEVMGSPFDLDEAIKAFIRYLREKYGLGGLG